MKSLWGPDGEVETSASPRTMHLIKGAMQGQSLYRMNVAALTYIAGQLHDIGDDGLRIPNLYRWLRHFMTWATSEALYGKENPVRKDPSLIEALW